MKNLLNQKLAELVGIMFGDGCLSRSGGKYIVYISGHKFDDFEYHSKTTKKLFKSLFNKEIRIGFRKDENTLFIRFSDKSIFEKFHSFGLPIGLKYSNLDIPKEFLSDSLFFSFIRGLFDTDGCLVFSKQHKHIPYYPRIEISSKSQTFLLKIFETLKEYGFYGSVSKKGNHFRLEIPGFKNFSLWLDLIGSNNPKHVNKFKKVNPKSL
jgi:intein/homing endonuclease